MSFVARLGRRSLRGASTALLLTLAALLLSLTDATAQRQLIDPRAFSLKPADLPRGFSVVESQTSFEPLRLGQSSTDADVVGVHFRTLMERPRTLEHLQSGPVRVSQMIARSDDPARATFALDAQREYSVREQGYAPVDAPVPSDSILCLVRRDGPFVEYRIEAIQNGDTLVSITATGLPSAVNLEGAIALMRLSLARYDEQVSTVLAVQPTPATAGRQEITALAVATATPTPVPPPPNAPAAPTSAPTQGPAPTAQALAPVAQPGAAAPQTATAGAPLAPAPRAKLPARFDDRLAQPWSELMNNTATTRSGDKMAAFLRRVVEQTDLEVSIGNLGPEIGGQLRSVVREDGDKLKVTDRELTINRTVLKESPQVLATMLAHEITHAGQPIRRSGGQLGDCVEAEVEAYAVEARVWSAFWGQTPRPELTSMERSMNYVAEIAKDSGNDGLRQFVRFETGTDAHSCVE